LIERAYRLGESLGRQVWCQAEAGPYQAIPQVGASWPPAGRPTRQPHEYVRGGTANLLALFRPATGERRAQPVEHAPNAVLHPWLQAELAAILATLPALSPDTAAAQAAPAYWAAWQAGLSVRPTWRADLPPLRVLLVWDNLSGHKTPELLCELFAQGILPLYTPLGGSWLNMAESIQRIVARRALEGQHPQSAVQVMEWLAATVDGWNTQPTPFVWGGKRAQRRWRQRQRYHALGGSAALTHRPLSRRRRP
jgi:hypothetical protein